MLPEDTWSDRDEDDTSEDERFLPEHLPKSPTNIHTSKAERCGHPCDDEHRLRDIDREECKRDTDRERIDTRRHSEDEEWWECKVLTRRIFFVTPRLTEHIDSDACEESKSNPVVDRLDPSRYTLCTEPADEWHDPLKGTKNQSKQECPRDSHSWRGAPRSDCDRKSIHREGEGEEEEGEYRHRQKEKSAHSIDPMEKCKWGRHSHLHMINKNIIF